MFASLLFSFFSLLATKLFVWLCRKADLAYPGKAAMLGNSVPPQTIPKQVGKVPRKGILMHVSGMSDIFVCPASIVADRPNLRSLSSDLPLHAFNPSASLQPFNTPSKTLQAYLLHFKINLYITY